MKLELKHICGYLPYGLMVLRPNGVTVLKCIGLLHDSYIFNEWSFGDFRVSINKMVLRPLTDLTKEITHKGETFVPIKVLDPKNSLSINPPVKQFPIDIMVCADYDGESIDLYRGAEVINKLQEWMFDIHGLIEKGLAIDVNTLEDNPYE